MTLLKQNNSNTTNQLNRLSVQISLTGLSFLVSSAEGAVLYFTEKLFKTLHTPEELLFELTDTLNENTSLTGQFAKVSLIYTTHNYTLVPSTLFDEGKASEYLKFNTKILKNDYISHDKIINHNTVVVYVPYMNINNYIFEKFGSFQYYHSNTLLLQYLLTKEKHSSTTKVFLHVSQNQLDCIVITNGKLTLCNTYSYKTPEDFVYYILFCLEQLQLNPDSVETTISGDISHDDPYYTMLYNYIRNVSFIDGNFPEINSISAHRHIVLKTSL